MVDGSHWNGFKYAMCNESLQAAPFEKQCRIIAEAGYQGIEIAPFTLVQSGVEDLDAADRRKLLHVIHESGLVCCGLHWLFAPPPTGLHFTTPDASVRQKSIEYLLQLVDFCADLQGEVLVFGSPQQRSADGISVAEATDYFADGLSKVADRAGRRGVRVLVEHLDRTQSNVVNTLAEARRLTDAVGHPAIQMMFDFHNTVDETQPLEELIRQYFDRICHVHVQEMDGSYLGTGGAQHEFVRAFQALKDLDYANWISLEVFDFAPGGQTIAVESMRVLQQIESRLNER
jgi:sugar phosphate isomerase/epimerase